jgi:hypothetical protein
MAKKHRLPHHPDYDPDIECGSLYVQKEVAVQMMLAIAYAMENNAELTDLDLARLQVAATAIDNVFALGARDTEEESDVD